MCIRDSTRTPATRRLRWLHSETLRPVSVQVQAQIAPQRSRTFGLGDQGQGCAPLCRYPRRSTEHFIEQEACEIMPEQDVFVMADRALNNVVQQIRDDQWGMEMPPEFACL